MGWLGLAARLATGTVWLVAGALKLPDPLLLAGALTRGVAAVSALLSLAFIIGIASAWARGLEIDCGCFGGGYDPDAASKYPWEIARDVALLLASLFLVRLPRSCLALDSLLFHPLTREDPA